MLLIRIQPVGGFVQHQHVGIMDQRLSKAGAVTKALGQGIDGLPEHRLQETQVHGATHRLSVCLTRQSAQFRCELEKTDHGHFTVGRRRLRQVADPLLGGNGVFQHVVTTNADPPFGRRDEPGDHAHGGGLAGPVGTEKSQHFAGLDFKRHIVHGALAAKRLGQVFNLDHDSSISEPHNVMRAARSIFFYLPRRHRHMATWQRNWRDPRVRPIR